MTFPKRASSAPGPIVDLFAGPGGWSQGLRMLGLSDIGIEWDDAACLTRMAAGHTATIRADVAAYPVEPFVDRPTWGLIASPPCQDFSLAGKRAGIEGDRGQLVWQVLRWADALRPQWIACEQVPPVEPIWKHMAHVMRGWGYRTWVGTLNAADYGVPQTRRRTFLLASLSGPVLPPAPTHGKDVSDGLWGSLLPWVSMAEALGWGMDGRPSVTVTAGGGRQGGPDPLDGGSGARETLRREQREGRWVVRTSFGEPKDDSRNGHHTFDPEQRPSHVVTTKTGDWVIRTGANSMRHSRTGSKAGDGGVVPYERSIDEPAPTLDAKVGGAWTLSRPATTVCADPRIFPPDFRGGRRAYELGLGNDPSQRAGTDSIKVTVEEASILQSFPPDYPWQGGTKSKVFEQIGNAVPPLLAAHILSAITGLPFADEVAA